MCSRHHTKSFTETISINFHDASVGALVTSVCGWEGLGVCWDPDCKGKHTGVEFSEELEVGGIPGSPSWR